ncbi:hypothetical protein AB0N73_06035 [Microbacterium sp. NPDC089189]|uniref:hypothetical protein n=1 Tax=Microbacterium sp. NPDC089189 TaxID=3154972 RepID=UPI003430F4E8
MNKAPARVRGRYGADARSAIPHVVAAISLMALAGTPLYGSVSVSAAVFLGTTAAAWVAASSFQDHVRTSLHISGDHGFAAIVSCLQLAISLAFFTFVQLATVHQHPSISTALPFGTLAVANLVSGLVGVWLHRSVNKISDESKVSFKLGLRTAASGFVLQGGAYALNLVVVLTLGASALATLEGVRIAAQPVLIASTALASFFLPPAIRLQAQGKTREANRRVRFMIGAQLSLGIAYASLVPFFAGLLSGFAGRSIPPLIAAAQTLSFSLQAMIAPINQMNIAANRFSLATMGTALSVAVSLVVLALTANSLHLYAVPLATASGALARGSLLILARHREQ